LELEKRYGGARFAWANFSEFYISQLGLVRDTRTFTTICTLLDIAYSFYHYSHRIPPQMPRSLAAESEDWKREDPSLQRAFPYFPYVHAESLYNHHGLRWSPRLLKDYVRSRDIIDVGASFGDSLVALINYTDRRVISYETDPALVRQANNYSNAARLPREKFLFIGKGISDVYVNESASFSTIDAEAKRLNFTAGLIKADIEGTESKVVLGALETIRRDQPILIMSIYHNEEILDLPKLLLGLGYKLRFQFGQYTWDAHWEAACIGIPNDLAAEVGDESHELIKSMKCHEYGPL
jgi:hypothetical protein